MLCKSVWFTRSSQQPRCRRRDGPRLLGILVRTMRPGSPPRLAILVRGRDAIRLDVTPILSFTQHQPLNYKGFAFVSYEGIK